MDTKQPETVAVGSDGLLDASGPTKLKLMWSTDTGCDWLAEDHESKRWDRATIMYATAEFVNRTKTMAESYVDGWGKHGEDVSMWPRAESQDKQLEAIANEYLDSLFT